MVIAGWFRSIFQNSIHDAFDLQRFSDFVAARSDFVVLDHHQCEFRYFSNPNQSKHIAEIFSVYEDFVFAPQDPNEPISQISTSITSTSGSISTTLQSASIRTRRNIVIDEFSCAISASAISNETDPILARSLFCSGQLETYTNDTAGYSFWSYVLEAQDDVNWSFKNAVGKSLPSTFFSYPGNYSTTTANGGDGSSHPSPVTPYLPALKSIVMPASKAVLQLAIPPNANDLLSSVRSSSSSASLSLAKRSTNFIQAAFSIPSNMSHGKGKKKNHRGLVKRVLGLVSKRQNDGSSDTDMNPSLTSSDSDPSSNDSAINVASIDGQNQMTMVAPPIQSQPQSQDQSTSSPTSPAPQSSGTSDSSGSSDDSDPTVQSNDGSGTSMSPKEAAISKGYSDGFRTFFSMFPFLEPPQLLIFSSQLSTNKETAKVFALTTGSRLGFIGQYIDDTISALGGSIAKGMEDDYNRWFLMGLSDGESQVATILFGGLAANT